MRWENPESCCSVPGHRLSQCKGALTCPRRREQGPSKPRTYTHFIPAQCRVLLSQGYQKDHWTWSSVGKFPSTAYFLSHTLWPGDPIQVWWTTGAYCKGTDLPGNNPQVQRAKSLFCSVFVHSYHRSRYVSTTDSPFVSSNFTSGSDRY